MDTERCTNPLQLLTQTTDIGGFAGSSVALLLGEGLGVSSSPVLGGYNWLQKRSPRGVAPVAW